MMKIILIGFGVVGQGLAKLLHEKQAALATDYGFRAQIVGVATGSRGTLYQPEGLDIPQLLGAIQQGSLDHYPDRAGLQRDFVDALDLLRRGSADVMVEVSPTNIQTAMPATAHIQTAIDTHKHVVTANKAPIALSLQDLQQRARTARCQLRYEATLMAGTPVINTALQALAGCRILAVEGIVNGTCNYMLSQMETGLSYSDALQQAQTLGYAETDPTADVAGYDAAAKVLIMLQAFFGKQTTLDQIAIEGIQQITSEQIAAAQAQGKRYKLLARASHEGGSVQLRTLAQHDPLAQVDGAQNAITFHTDVLGAVTIIGAGAGQRETAFGLLNDLLAIHRGF